MKKSLVTKIFEPGEGNRYDRPEEKAPEPPEGFVDNTVKVFRLNPDGSKGELVRTMEAFPEGWDDPHKLREKRFQKKKEEVKEMPKKDIDFEAIVAKVKQIMTEQDVSLYKASGIVAKETGLHRTTVYNHARAMLQTPNPEPAQVASQKPERVAEDATLDEMKVIWIENVLTHCTQAKTQLQYIQAIMDLRV